ncbi:hypothetical protein ThimaDRAFT_4064 [Thiocapsa marina 5811]|uniref:Uncharacterized protein n=1 Tax=Thiocapsa marina 5811 TaxID=768671 RepID=F9UGL1_9GAMM|nr:hypothetical protein ThimaDRAFT_4064 [Thiocapsa marina 5811]
MRPTTTRSLSAFALSAVTMTFAFSGSVFAASACKGLEEAACGTTEACRWQAGYTRKDGVEVASHCRSTGKAKAAAPEAPAADAAASEGTDKAS